MKIVLSGYYGFGNAGDEAILETIVADMRELAPEAQLVVLSGAPAETAERYDVEAVARTNGRAIVRALRGATLFVSGGGSLLQDVTSGRTVPYYTGLMGIARRMGVPVFVYAQGLGPIRRPRLRRRTGRALARADRVTLRDRPSVNEALALGVNEAHIHLTADPVFGLADQLDGPVTEDGQRLLAALPDGPFIGLSLRPLLGRGVGPEHSGLMVDTVIHQLTTLLPRLGARVVPLPLYAAQDDPLLQTVVERLGDDAVRWPRGVTPDALMAADWLALLRRMDLCITMRLHGLIFAAAAEVPFVALADDPKVDAHIAELGFDAEAVAVGAGELVNDGTAFASVVQKAWNDREAARDQLQVRVPALARRAKETAYLAVERAEAEVEARRRSAILGTEFDRVTMGEAVAAAGRFIDGRTGAHIVTANPELVMGARHDADVRDMLHGAELIVADGIGVVAAASLLGNPVPERVPGVELMEALLTEGEKREWRVFLLGGEPGVAEEAAVRIGQRWPGIHVVGVRDGYFAPDEEEAVAAQIEKNRPHIVFVGMGAPRQELFIARRRGLFGGVEKWDVPLAVGVGGSIDVIAGRVPRAPVVWQKLGLEWMYRLLRQPSRLRRAAALPKFALLVLFHAFRRNLL